LLHQNPTLAAVAVEPVTSQNPQSIHSPAGGIVAVVGAAARAVVVVSVAAVETPTVLHSVQAAQTLHHSQTAKTPVQPGHHLVLDFGTILVISTAFLIPQSSTYSA
jgi:hypothetical protein